MDYEVWHKRLQTKLPYIAEDNGEIVGFGELEADGHIDCFIVIANTKKWVLVQNY
jgi:hypothetical protein